MLHRLSRSATAIQLVLAWNTDSWCILRLFSLNSTGDITRHQQLAADDNDWPRQPKKICNHNHMQRVLVVDGIFGVTLSTESTRMISDEEQRLFFITDLGIARDSSSNHLTVL